MTPITKTVQIFKEHIIPYSYFINDYEKSDYDPDQELHLNSESYKLTYISELNDKDNSLDKINHYCDLLKKFQILLKIAINYHKTKTFRGYYMNNPIKMRV